MSARRRALVVCPSLPLPAVSGGRKRTLRLIEAMARAGAQPHLLALEGSLDAIAACRARGWNAEVIGHRPSPLAPLRRVRQDVLGEPEPHLPALAERIAQLSVDAAVVQVEEAWMEQYHPAASRRALRIASPHNADSEMLRSFAAAATDGRERLRLTVRAVRMARTERRVARVADLVVAVSDHDADWFRSHGARNVAVVPNGVDDELLELEPGAGEPGRVLFFGAFHWAPNRDGLTRFLAEGWNHVVERAASARLRVVGPGDLTRIRAAAESVRGVEVAGLVKDIAAELAVAQVVVVPVWTGGGTRIKVLEAMAAARPVVGTPVGVERIGFRDGQHGLVADTPVGLADQIARLLEDPDRGRRLGTAARKHVRPLRWAAVTAPLEDRYRAALEGRR